MRGAREESAPLLHDHGHGHGLATARDLESSGHHVHVDLQAHSSFRSFMLFLSLSLHSVFEGLAIGLQSTDSKVRQTKSPDGNCDRVLFFFFFFLLNPHKLLKARNRTSLLLRVKPVSAFIWEINAQVKLKSCLQSKFQFRASENFGSKMSRIYFY